MIGQGTSKQGMYSYLGRQQITGPKMAASMLSLTFLIAEITGRLQADKEVYSRHRGFGRANAKSSG